jgi:hypothetical protein
MTLITTVHITKEEAADRIVKLRKKRESKSALISPKHLADVCEAIIAKGHGVGCDDDCLELELIRLNVLKPAWFQQPTQANSSNVRALEAFARVMSEVPPPVRRRRTYTKKAN